MRTKIIKFPQRPNKSLKCNQLNLFPELKKEELEFLKTINLYKKEIRNWQIKLYEFKDLKKLLLAALEEIKLTGDVLSFKDIKIRHKLTQDLKYVNEWIDASYDYIEVLSKWLSFNKYSVN